MVKSRVEFEVETLIEEYEWLVSYREVELNGSSEVYSVIINLNDINFEDKRVNDVHIENMEYLYYISGGDEKIIDLGYDIFKVIEREVVEEIKSFL